MTSYVHGYSDREAVRLADQAGTLAEMLHVDTLYPPGDRVLEIGCGTGAQTVILYDQSPNTRFLSVDRSRDSLTAAVAKCEGRGIPSAPFVQADLFQLPFKDQTFDHVFVCFVLEHLPDPQNALVHLARVLKPNGSVTAIEGDHGSFYCHPETEEGKSVVGCLIRAQAHLGGDSLIGRRLYPLLTEAGFRDVQVSPRIVYVDSSRPALVEGFSKNTFIAMVEGVKDQALAMNMVTPEVWRKGIADLYSATEDDGTFCYTFFKAVGRKAGP